MTVQELNSEELEELTTTYFNELEGFIQYGSPSKIPIEIIYNHYEGISFVKEDFFCNI